MKIGIIGALDEEIELLSSHMKNQTKQEYTSFIFNTGLIENKKIVLVKSGAGKVNAASCAQILIDKFNVNKIIFIGVAGALNPKLKIEDIVISKDCIQHDVDGESLGFKKGQILFTDMMVFKADQDLIDKTLDSANKLNLKVITGRILSGDQFINSKEKSKELREEFDGDCVEMEGASFAQVCLLNNIPHISIRSISDLADHSANVNFNEFCKHSADKVCPLVIELIKNIDQEKFDLKSSIRTISNYSKEGIMFRDITTLLKDPKAFKESLNILEERYQSKKINAIAGIEARGFIFGAALADRLNVGFIPIRKKGKLPGEILAEEYELEYGSDIIEIHKDAIKKGDNILLIDDLIATGGTCIAAIKLIEKLEAQIFEASFIIGLLELGGIKKIKDLGIKVFTMVDFDGE